MNIQQAEEVINGIKAECEGGNLDWGFVDSADSICHSWLLLNSDNVDKIITATGTSCFGLAYEAEEVILGEYLAFMKDAIADQNSAKDEIVNASNSFLKNAHDQKQYELAFALFHLTDKSLVLRELPDIDHFIKLLIQNAANKGNKKAIDFFDMSFACLTSQVATKFLEDESVDLCDFNSIDEKAAEMLSRHEGVLNLSGLNSMAENIAKHLSEHQGFLNLSGLRVLHENVAKLLVKHVGDLALSGVEELSAETSKHFCSFESTLIFSGLQKISEAVAENLSGIKGSLFLGVSEISEPVAKKLSSSHAEGIYFNKLNALSPIAAKGLANYEGHLLIGGLSDISDAVAESLSNFRGILELEINDLPTSVAEKLSASQAKKISFTTLSEITPGAAEYLSDYKNHLCFESLNTLTGSVAEKISKCECDLSFDGLNELSNEASEHLSKHRGELSLEGIGYLSIYASKKLSEHRGNLGLDGLRSLSEIAAEHFASFIDYELSLGGLEYISDEAAKALAKRAEKRSPESMNISDPSLLMQIVSYWSEIPSWISEHIPSEMFKVRVPNLHFKGLTKLDEELAETLSHYQGRSIRFDNLKEINLSVADKLSNYEVKLSGSRNEVGLTIGKLSDLNDLEAQNLAKSKCQYLTLYLDELSSSAAQKLASFSGTELKIYIPELSDPVAHALSEFKGVRLTLPYLPYLSSSAAESLSTCHCEIDLEFLDFIGDSAAESLAKHEGTVNLVGLRTTLSTFAAQKLSNYEGSLFLSGNNEKKVEYWKNNG